MPAGREDDPEPVCWTTWVRPLAAPVTPVVIGDGATAYVGSGYEVVALNTLSGGIRFRADVGGRVEQPAALAGGFLHVAAADGRLSAVRADGCGATSCTPAWSTTPGSAATVQPAVAGG